MGKKMIEIAEFLYKFIALNFLWFLFLLIGLGIFGFMPATVAVFAVIREWLRGNKEFPLFSTYYKYYKADFLRANLLGVIFLGIFYLLYVNFVFVSFYYPEETHVFIYFVILSISSIILLTLINLFSVMAHFEYKTLKYMKVALGLVFLKPINTLLQLIWIFTYILALLFYPKIIIVVGVSVFAYVLMSINYSIFRKYVKTA